MQVTCIYLETAEACSPFQLSVHAILLLDVFCNGEHYRFKFWSQREKGLRDEMKVVASYEQGKLEIWGNFL